jgi:hypothetical protein
MTTREQAEQDLRDWAINNASRDLRVIAALRAGVPKKEIHLITGIARTTINRIEETAVSDAIRTATDRIGTLGQFASRTGDSARTARDSIARIIAQIEEPPMTTTTSYGTFVQHADTISAASIDTYVASALGEFAGDYDTDALTGAFRDAINAELDGTGVSLHGNEFYGPHPHQDVDIAAAIERVDFWEIAAKHERS